MALSNRESVIVRVSNALTIYAIGSAEGRIPAHTTPHQFVLDTVPDSARSDISADLVDEIFAALQTVHK